MADYKEGVDYELVLMKNQPKGGTNKTRRFFTAAEKAARKAPKTAPSAAKAPAPTKSAKPKKSADTGVAKDPMKGYRKGDVTTAPIGGTGGRTAPKSTADIAATAKKALFKQPQRPRTSQRIDGPFTIANVTALQDYTRAEYDAMTPEQRTAKGLPRYTTRYAIRDDSFKPATTVAPTKKPSTIAQAGKVGRYAKGGMVKKGKC